MTSITSNSEFYKYFGEILDNNLFHSNTFNGCIMYISNNYKIHLFQEKYTIDDEGAARDRKVLTLKQHRELFPEYKFAEVNLDPGNKEITFSLLSRRKKAQEINNKFSGDKEAIDKHNREQCKKFLDLIDPKAFAGQAILFCDNIIVKIFRRGETREVLNGQSLIEY